MLFNSIEFLLFLPVIFILYWIIGTERRYFQNILVLLASYFFYGWWNWKFLGLLFGSTLLDYFYAFGVSNQSKSKAKIFLWLSIINNLGILAVFKYYNFFIEQTTTLIKGLGIPINMQLLSIALPVGISFYTFHGMSYVFDVYRKKITPIRNFSEYAVFVSFFPLLVAGPIERATHLLPQIQNKRHFSYQQSVEGLRLILWGIFKKVVLADNCAYFANEIFNNYSSYNAPALFLGAFFFSIQIYGDFSGYSDVALGTAKLFGFELLINFKFPYFSRNLAEFWKRWHISLSGWFRDYLYIPLGGSKNGKLIAVRNTIIVFFVSGFWHGASWNFVIWGIFHAFGFLPILIFDNTKKYTTNSVSENKFLPSVKEQIGMLFTFGYVLIGWVFFRAPNLSIAWQMISKILSNEILNFPNIVMDNTERLKLLHIIISMLIVLISEWVSRSKEYSTYFFNTIDNMYIKWALYLTILIMIVYFKGDPIEFIYFAF